MTFQSASDIIEGTRRTGILPTIDEQAGLSEEDQGGLCRAWLEGMQRGADAAHAREVSKFKARGWAFRWFAEWKPDSAKDQLLSDAIDEAVDVVAQYYPAIVDRGLDQSEDMGILQSKGFGGSEGIQAKREAYGRLVLVSVHCVTGPRNMEAGSDSVEFEPGARSHVFHLVYAQLPSLERLAGDIAAYPVIKSPQNQADGSNTIWMSEGWVSKSGDHHKSRSRMHRPWDTIRALCHEPDHPAPNCPETVPISCSR